MKNTTIAVIEVAEQSGIAVSATASLREALCAILGSQGIEYSAADSEDGLLSLYLRNKLGLDRATEVRALRQGEVAVRLTPRKGSGGQLRLTTKTIVEVAQHDGIALPANASLKLTLCQLFARTNGRAPYSFRQSTDELLANLIRLVNGQPIPQRYRAIEVPVALSTQSPAPSAPRLRTLPLASTLTNDYQDSHDAFDVYTFQIDALMLGVGVQPQRRIFLTRGDGTEFDLEPIAQGDAAFTGAYQIQSYDLGMVAISFSKGDDPNVFTTVSGYF